MRQEICEEVDETSSPKACLFVCCMNFILRSKNSQWANDNLAPGKRKLSLP